MLQPCVTLHSANWKFIFRNAVLIRDGTNVIRHEVKNEVTVLCYHHNNGLLLFMFTCHCNFNYQIVYLKYLLIIVLGPCPSSGILETRVHSISKTVSV